MPTAPIYLDHAATTPIDPRVFEAMAPVLTSDFGNASSVHRLGRKARFLVEDARERVAHHLGAEPSEIVFTSSGTESNNTALFGAAPSCIVTEPAEHEAVLQPSARLMDSGVEVVYVPVDEDGAVLESHLADALSDRDPGLLVSIMTVNNETGMKHDIQSLASAAHGAGGIFHTDAVQAAGVSAVDVDALDVDLMTISGHKLYGPKGVAVLYVRGGTPFRELIAGGSQERGRRAGTENVAAIVGMARAMELSREELADRNAHLSRLQSRLMQGIEDSLGPHVLFNTPLREDSRAPHIVNVSFPPLGGIPMDGEMLLLGLDMEGICASSGSACTSGTIRPSHVLLAMGRDEATARAAVRFSIGKDNTEQDIDAAIEALVCVTERLRQKSKTLA